MRVQLLPYLQELTCCPWKQFPQIKFLHVKCLRPMRPPAHAARYFLKPVKQRFIARRISKVRSVHDNSDPADVRFSFARREIDVVLGGETHFKREIHVQFLTLNELFQFKQGFTRVLYRYRIFNGVLWKQTVKVKHFFRGVDVMLRVFEEN